MGHGLLVVGAIDRQRVARLRQGLAQPGDIAVAEDRPHAADVRHQRAVLLRHAQRGQVPH